MRDFKTDEEAGFWNWLGLTRSLLDDVRALSRNAAAPLKNVRMSSGKG